MESSAQPVPQRIAEIRKEQRAIRFLYFFFFAGTGIYFTFINVYYRSIGLSGFQIGLINTLGPLVGVFSALLWGMLSDRLGKIRLLLSMAGLGVVIFTMVLAAARTYLAILSVVAFFNLFYSPIVSLLDSTTLRMLGDQGENYGTYRAFGSLGFILTSFTSGFIFDQIGLGAMFPAYALLMLCFAGIALGLRSTSVRLSSSPIGGLKKMVRQPRWVLFAASAFLVFLAASGAISFIGITVQAMGGSEKLIGFTWTAAAVFELPVMFNSAWLLRRLGASRVIGMAVLGYTLRIFLFSIMPSPTWAPLINSLNAVSYVPYWIGAVTYANELAPADLKATSQGLFFSVINMANVFGAIFAGWLFDQVGPSSLYRVLSSISLAAFILFAFGQIALRRFPQPE